MNNLLKTLMKNYIIKSWGIVGNYVNLKRLYYFRDKRCVS